MKEKIMNPGWDNKAYSSPCQNFIKFMKCIGSLGRALALCIISPGPSAGSAGQLLFNLTNPQIRGNGIQFQEEGAIRQKEDLLSVKAWSLGQAIKAGG